MNLGDRAMMFMGNQQMPYPPGHPLQGQMPPGPSEQDQKATAARMRMLKWIGGLLGAYFAYRFIKVCCIPVFIKVETQKLILRLHTLRSSSRQWMWFDKHGGKVRIPEAG